MLYKKGQEKIVDQEGQSRTYNNVFYYKPENYNNFIRFNRVTPDVWGNIQHNKKLPDDVTEAKAKDITKGMLKLLDFLDETN